MDGSHPSTDGTVTGRLRAPAFIYFDLGNVLLNFDHRRAARQMGEVAGLAPEAIWDLVFADGLEHRYERGEVTTAEFHAAVCRHTPTPPPLDALARAASDIFEPNRSVLELLAALQRRGSRLGLLSNTNEAHWTFIGQSFPELPRRFEVIALSYELGLLKPEPEIYREAARLAGCAPGEIFFVDDRPDNVAGAQAAGFDAVQFRGHETLSADLHARGLGR